MDLQTFINSCRKDAEYYSELVKQNERKLELAASSHEITCKELIHKYITGEIKSTVKKGIYEYILGGDGRSEPWSESRQGQILTINVPHKYYLSTQEKEKFIVFLKTTEDFDHIYCEFEL